MERQLTWRTPGDLVKVDVLADLLAARMHLEDLHTPRHIGPVYRHLPVKTPRTQQRRVQHLRKAGKSVHMRTYVLPETQPAASGAQIAVRKVQSPRCLTKTSLPP